MSTEQELTRRCPACDGVMQRGVRNETVTYQGHSLSYEQPGWYCDACDDGVLEGDDNAYYDAALHEVMAHAEGLPTSPATVAVARTEVGLGLSKR